VINVAQQQRVEMRRSRAGGVANVDVKNGKVLRQPGFPAAIAAHAYKRASRPKNRGIGEKNEFYIAMQYKKRDFLMCCFYTSSRRVLLTCGHTVWFYIYPKIMFRLIHPRMKLACASTGGMRRRHGIKSSM
jgi:hypothetical protein